MLHLWWDDYYAASTTLANCLTLAWAEPVSTKPRQVDAWAAPAIDSTNAWAAVLCPQSVLLANMSNGLRSQDWQNAEELRTKNDVFQTFEFVNPYIKYR